jgi:predicted ferric reductase
MISKQASSPEKFLKFLSLGIGITLGHVTAALLIFLIFVVSSQANLDLTGDSLVQGLPVVWQQALIHQAHVMGFPLQGETSAFWYMSRMSALLAYLLLWGSTIWGLMLSTKIVKVFVPPALTFSVHEFLSLLGLGFAIFHALVLLGDQYINFKLLHLLVPFTAPDKPFWVGVGTLSLYLYALISMSFYIRRHLGQRAWRVLHYLTFLTYVMALTHGLVIGSESELGSIRLMYLASAASVLFLVYYRILSKGKFGTALQ